MLIAWHLWNERNGPLFQRRVIDDLTAQGNDSAASAWLLAGAKHLVGIVEQ